MSFSENLKPAILGIGARTSREHVTDPSRWAISVYRETVAEGWERAEMSTRLRVFAAFYELGLVCGTRFRFHTIKINCKFFFREKTSLSTVCQTWSIIEYVLWNIALFSPLGEDNKQKIGIHHNFHYTFGKDQNSSLEEIVANKNTTDVCNFHKYLLYKS